MRYFATDGGFSKYAFVAPAASHPQVPPVAAAHPSTLVSIHPTFAIKDWEKAKPIMEDFVARTKNEAGCVYYGWVRDGDKLKCREMYVDGAAVNAHLENVGPAIQALLAPEIVSLDDINIQGPADQLEIVKPGTEALGTKYYCVDSGFSKYTVAA